MELIRSRKYLDAARGQPCQIKIPNVCSYDSSTVVAAHSNKQRHGKGTGLKAHDVFVAWACDRCHSAIDGRIQTDLSPQELQEFWQWGFERTLISAIEQGFIKL